MWKPYVLVLVIHTVLPMHFTPQDLNYASMPIEYLSSKPQNSNAHLTALEEKYPEVARVIQSISKKLDHTPYQLIIGGQNCKEKDQFSGRCAHALQIPIKEIDCAKIIDLVTKKINKKIIDDVTEQDLTNLFVQRLIAITKPESRQGYNKGALIIKNLSLFYPYLRRNKSIPYFIAQFNELLYKTQKEKAMNLLFISHINNTDFDILCKENQQGSQYSKKNPNLSLIDHNPMLLNDGKLNDQFYLK